MTNEELIVIRINERSLKVATLSARKDLMIMTNSETIKEAGVQLYPLTDIWKVVWEMRDIAKEVEDLVDSLENKKEK